MRQIERDVSREIQDKLEEYKKLLLKWNQKINLVSKNTENDVDVRHIDDSLQIRDYLSIEENIIDLGSGGGLPGIILGILGYKVSLVEADSRKCAFLREVIRRLGLDVCVIEERAEKLKIDCDTVIARGFADINKIFDLTTCIKSDRFLLLKGKNAREEVVDAEKNWIFNYKKYKSITAEDAFILDIDNVRKKT